MIESLTANMDGIMITLIVFTLGLVWKNTKDLSKLCGYINRKENSGNKY